MANGVDPTGTPRGGNFLSPYSYKGHLEDFEGIGERRLGFDSMGVEVSGVFKSPVQPADAQKALEALEHRKKAQSYKEKMTAAYSEAHELVSTNFEKYGVELSSVPPMVSDSVIAAVMGSRKTWQWMRKDEIDVALAREMFDLNQLPAASEKVVRGMTAMCDTLDCLSVYGKKAKLPRDLFIDEMTWAYASAVEGRVDEDKSNGAGGSNGANGKSKTVTWTEVQRYIAGRRHRVVTKVDTSLPASVALSGDSLTGGLAVAGLNSGNGLASKVANNLMAGLRGLLVPRRAYAL